MKYDFRVVDRCNMCGHQDFKVLGKRLNTSQGFKPDKMIGFAVAVVKCRNCKLIFPDPIPYPETLEQHYGVPPEDYWVADYFTVSPDYFAPQIRQVKEFLKNRDQIKALDIGAGIGKCMIAFDRAGFDAYGIEPSPPFYDRALNRMKVDPDRIQNKSIEDADFEENMFDFITFGAVLEHLYDPAGSIEKAMHWLRPGGYIHIEVPSSKWLVGKIINAAYRILGLDYVGNISPCHPPFHIYEFGLPSFQAHARQNNYRIAYHEYFNGKTYMPKPLDVVLQPIMRKTNTGMQLTIWLQKNPVEVSNKQTPTTSAVAEMA